MVKPELFDDDGGVQQTTYKLLYQGYGQALEKPVSRRRCRRVLSRFIWLLYVYQVRAGAHARDDPKVADFVVNDHVIG